MALTEPDLILCHHCGEVFLAPRTDRPLAPAQDHTLDRHPEAWNTAVFSDLWSYRIVELLGATA